VAECGGLLNFSPELVVFVSHELAGTPRGRGRQFALPHNLTDTANGHLIGINQTPAPRTKVAILP
jgi:hypothetical protein